MCTRSFPQVGCAHFFCLAILRNGVQCSCMLMLSISWISAPQTLQALHMYNLSTLGSSAFPGRPIIYLFHDLAVSPPSPSPSAPHREFHKQISDEPTTSIISTWCQWIRVALSKLHKRAEGWSVDTKDHNKIRSARYFELPSRYPSNIFKCSFNLAHTCLCKGSLIWASCRHLGRLCPDLKSVSHSGPAGWKEYLCCTTCLGTAKLSKYFATLLTRHWGGILELHHSAPASWVGKDPAERQANRPWPNTDCFGSQTTDWSYVSMITRHRMRATLPKFGTLKRGCRFKLHEGSGIHYTGVSYLSFMRPQWDLSTSKHLDLGSQKLKIFVRETSCQGDKAATNWQHKLAISHICNPSEK